MVEKKTEQKTEQPPDKIAAGVTLDDLVLKSTEYDQDKAKAEIVKNLMLKENLERVSEVDNLEICLMSALKSANSDIDSVQVKAFIDSILELRISHTRKGREEIVKITQNEALRPPERKGLFGRFWS